MEVQRVSVTRLVGDVPAGRRVPHRDADVYLRDLDAGTPETIAVWMSCEQLAYWSCTHLTIDVVPGRGAGCSLEAPTGSRFLIRSWLYSREEAGRWKQCPDCEERRHGR